MFVFGLLSFLEKLPADEIIVVSKKPRFFLVILSVLSRLKRSVFRIQYVFPYPNVFGISKASKGPCKKKLTF